MRRAACGKVCITLLFIIILKSSNILLNDESRLKTLLLSWYKNRPPFYTLRLNEKSHSQFRYHNENFESPTYNNNYMIQIK